MPFNFRSSVVNMMPNDAGTEIQKKKKRVDYLIDFFESHAANGGHDMQQIKNVKDILDENLNFHVTTQVDSCVEEECLRANNKLPERQIESNLD